jgi:predicted type IV restriction endonuclease
MEDQIVNTSIAGRVSVVQKDLRTGRFTSEAAVSNGIVLPLLHELGWPVFDTEIVVPQFSLEGRRVDYALCGRRGQPHALIEVKRVGLAEGGDKQLFEYAFVRGVPLAVLSDGQEWSFYLPGEQGHYNERRVYKLDLLERSAEECGARLARYLGADDVRSGKALEAARADYRDVARLREIDEALPVAWSALLAEQDSVLLELLAERVEDICGYRPDLDRCAQFLSSAVSGGVPRSDLKSERLRGVRNKEELNTGVAGRDEGFSFRLDGVTQQATSAREVLAGLLRTFARADETFLDRLAARKHGRKRRYVARTRAELYPGRPDLAESHAIELLPGWWMGTNYSRRSIGEIIGLAAEVAGVSSTRLSVRLGPDAR